MSIAIAPRGAGGQPHDASGGWDLKPRMPSTDVPCRAGWLAMADALVAWRELFRASRLRRRRVAAADRNARRNACARAVCAIAAAANAAANAKRAPAALAHARSRAARAACLRALLCWQRECTVLAREAAAAAVAEAKEKRELLAQARHGSRRFSIRSAACCLAPLAYQGRYK
eukprot:527721-Pleurochrysis_carterae.AAC.3